MTQPELTPLEIASGIVCGQAADRVALPKLPPGQRPLDVLERVIRPALEQPPCLVSFSGGRDSSAVLAVAARLARREGLPLPIPATNSFAGVEHSDESDWQELVVAHLRLDDWLRLDFTDELDVVGPVATAVLRRHGLLWPFNSHFHAPLLAAARGGSLLTGIGGDEVLGASYGGRRFFLAPRVARRVVLARRIPRMPWLQPRAQAALARALADDTAGQPRGFRRRLAHWQRLRYLRVGLRSLDLIAGSADAAILHPLAAPEFSAALAASSGWRGVEDRTRSMRELFGELLPRELLERATKARFEGAFWGSYSRRLVRDWNGEGADPATVDIPALRTEWATPEPDGHTYLQLQAAWLAKDSSSVGARGVDRAWTAARRAEEQEPVRFP